MHIRHETISNRMVLFIQGMFWKCDMCVNIILYAGTDKSFVFLLKIHIVYSPGGMVRDEIKVLPVSEVLPEQAGQLPVNGGVAAYDLPAADIIFAAAEIAAYAAGSFEDE